MLCSANHPNHFIKSIYVRRLNVEIVIVVCLLGWIPILAIGKAIAMVVREIKVDDEEFTSIGNWMSGEDE